MFYGVYGTNGGGVFGYWGKVLESRPYIKSFKAKKFSTREEAVDYIIKGIAEYGVLAEEKIDRRRLMKTTNFFNYLYVLTA